MTRCRVRSLLGLISILLVAEVQIARAQVVTGTILGTVRDPAGAVVPGVSISAKSLESGAVRTATTDGFGAYQILSVPAGNYEVDAVAQGFQTLVRNTVTVTVGASVTLNFDLVLGEVKQEVTVVSEAPTVNMMDATLGGLVGEQEVRELPLNGRDWLQLTTLQAGVNAGIGQQSAASFSNSRAARGNGLALSISGNRPTGNVFLVDGLVVNDFANASPGSGLNVNLGVEAVREFRVLTDEYTAEYGRSTGGVVTAVFESGTNEFHGNVFEFLRNSALDSRNFFDAQKPPFRRNQFGASVGGPVTKNKTFVFGDYEELRDNKGIPHASDTLSPDARNGIVCVSRGADPCVSKTSMAISDRIRPYLAFFPVANGPITGDTAKFIFAGQRIGVERYLVGK